MTLRIAPPREAWIGQTEFRLLANALEPRAGDTLLDVGCGPGYFTRLFAARTGSGPGGLDSNPAWLRFVDDLGVRAAIALVAIITAPSGTVVALRMHETVPRFAARRQA
jgi:SAM-dependent methyltransferase